MTAYSATNRIKLAFECILPVLLVLLLGWLFKMEFGSWITSGNWHLLYYNRLVFWGSVALLWLYAKWVNRKPYLLWKEQAYPFSFYIKWAVLLYLLTVGAGVVSLIPQLLGYRESNAIMARMIQLMSHSWMLMIFAAVTAGITEELLFRGFMQPRMQLLFNSPAAALVVTSLLFAGLHYSYHNLRELIFTFLVGIILGFHYQKYRNIKVVIIAHFLIDMIAFILSNFVKYKM